jgi:hypothetical protein
MTHDVDTIIVTERTTPDYVANLVDRDDNPVPGDVLDTLTLTYTTEYGNVVLNGRDKQSVHNANDVELNDAGDLVWRMRPEDTVILDDSLHEEPHIALFEFSYAGPSGTEFGKHQVRILVRNLERVPA